MPYIKDVLKKQCCYSAPADCNVTQLWVIITILLYISSSFKLKAVLIIFLDLEAWMVYWACFEIIKFNIVKILRELSTKWF